LFVCLLLETWLLLSLFFLCCLEVGVLVVAVGGLWLGLVWFGLVCFFGLCLRFLFVFVFAVLSLFAYLLFWLAFSSFLF